MKTPANDLQLETFKLGEEGGRIRVEGRLECQQVVQKLASEARLHLEIFTYDLDAPLYDDLIFLGEVKRLARSSRNLCLRILLQNNEKVQREGHRLIDLARRITSKIEIRKPHPDYIDHLESFIIADTQGFLRRPVGQRYDGEANFKDLLKAREMMQFYNEIWESSEPDSDLRRLYL